MIAAFGARARGRRERRLRPRGDCRDREREQAARDDHRERLFAAIAAPRTVIQRSPEQAQRPGDARRRARARCRARGAARWRAARASPRTAEPRRTRAPRAAASPNARSRSRSSERRQQQQIQRRGVLQEDRVRRGRFLVRERVENESRGVRHGDEQRAPAPAASRGGQAREHHGGRDDRAHARGLPARERRQLDRDAAVENSSAPSSSWMRAMRQRRRAARRDRCDACAQKIRPRNT